MRIWISCIAMAAALLIHAADAPPATDKPAFTYKSADRFKGAVAAFQKADQEAPPPAGAIVAIGSSSMRMWTTIGTDLAPVTVIHRGFGGSTMNDALVFTDQLIIAYKPRAVLIYEGDNDIAAGAPPELVRATLLKLIEKVHAALPECRFYVMSVKPSPSRWKLWPAMERTNALFKETCAADPLLTYVDIARPMLDPDGKVRDDIFREDKLHMNSEGYRLWTMVVQPVLIVHELTKEKK